jgi:hypothetical protein
MTKVRTTITIEKDLLEKARNYDINLSSFLEMKLVEYLAYMEGILDIDKKSINASSNKKFVRRGGDLDSVLLVKNNDLFHILI